MSVEFNSETSNIYRLKVPFEKIYTSVFLIKTEERAILVDCATTPSDVDDFIVPCLEKLGYKLGDIKAIVLTHKHGDHAGGLGRVLELAPNIEVVREVRPLFCGISTYPMSGHTSDSIGVFDERTRTLISGDGLQGAGVDRYRCFTQEPEKYMETIEIIMKDRRIENILFSHAYEPWNSNRAIGRDAVEHCLVDCKKYVKEEKNESNTCK